MVQKDTIHHATRIANKRANRHESRAPHTNLSTCVIVISSSWSAHKSLAIIRFKLTSLAQRIDPIYCALRHVIWRGNRSPCILLWRTRSKTVVVLMYEQHSFSCTLPWFTIVLLFGFWTHYRLCYLVTIILPHPLSNWWIPFCAPFRGLRSYFSSVLGLITVGHQQISKLWNI